ncbi:MAG TPA: putative zinc-binding protein [Verrucomicrobiae bacterium]|nr:putative zinc-binding protein [Verrucomicrobiae bacterium]
MNHEASTSQEAGPKAEAPVKKATIVYACSGCSDAGEIADRIARRLTREGAAQMSCLAGIGGRVKSLVIKAENAEHILVVDGCPLNCAAHTLKLAGFQKFDHLELQKIGIRKGSCPVTDERISAGVEAAKQLISKTSEPEADSADLIAPFCGDNQNKRPSTQN